MAQQRVQPDPRAPASNTRCKTSHKHDGLSARPSRPVAAPHLGRVLNLCRRVVAIMLASFAVFLLITGTQLAVSQLDQLVPALGITYFYVYLAMPVGALFVLLFALGLMQKNGHSSL